MTDSFYWSASAGRWMGIPVRIHVLLFLFIAVIFGVEWSLPHSRSLVAGTAFVTSIVLIFSLLLHELAHVFAITNLGGHVNNIVLSPWGGNSDFALPTAARDRAIVYLAGPFANGIVAALGCAMLIQTDQAALKELIYPLNPNPFSMSDWESSLLVIVTWVNFQLFLINMIPCFPFDMAGVLRSVVSWVNPHVAKIRSETSIMVIGHAVAFTMIGFAWLIQDVQTRIQPAWFFLLAIGITLLFSARYSFYAETANDEEDWDSLDDLDYESLYDESSFFEFPEDETSGYSQWLAEKQEARKREETRIEREEDRRADEILKRLHHEGIENISEEDRLLLNRVSQRLRRQRKVTDTN